MAVTFRLLTTENATAFKDLRLKALETDGSAFLSDLESEKLKTVARFSQEIVFTSFQAPFGYYGCFVDELLVGYVQIGWSGLSKQRHVAFLYNLYFDPVARGHGYATQLVAFVIQLLRDHQLEKVFASCVASNQTAFHFYQRFGFSEYGRKLGSVKWQGEYDDEIELVLAFG